MWRTLCVVVSSSQQLQSTGSVWEICDKFIMLPRGEFSQRCYNFYFQMCHSSFTVPGILQTRTTNKLKLKPNKALDKNSSLTCYMGSHAVTCHPRQVNVLCHNPKAISTKQPVTYPRGMEGWVDLGHPEKHYWSIIGLSYVCCNLKSSILELDKSNVLKCYVDKHV